MTTFIHEPDGEGEPTLWAADRKETIYPAFSHVAIIRRVDLSPETRHHWDELVERITGEKP
jgi:hypothetical protein